MAIIVGSVGVDVVPDTRQFSSRLRAGLGNLPKIDLDVTADLTRLRAELDELTRARRARIDVDVDDAAARARLDELARSRRATIDVDVDDHGSTSGATSRIQGLIAAGLAIGPALIPVAAAAAAAIASIGAGAVAGAVGIGTLALGFGGIGAAVKALGTQQQAASVNAGKFASGQINAAAAIASAEASLKNTRANAGDAAVRAANGVSQAIEREKEAEQTLVQAQTASLRAQKALTQARVDAKRALEDLDNQLADGLLSARQDELNLEQAKDALAAFGPAAVNVGDAMARLTTAQTIYQNALNDPATLQAQKDQAKAAVDAAQQQLTAAQAQAGAGSLAQQQAQLAYDQALQQLKEQQLANQRLKTDKAAADKAGVDGSKQVVDAQGNVTKATQDVVDAQRGVKDSTDAVAQSRRDQASQERQSAFAISQAEAAVASAHRQATAASDANTASVVKLHNAMDGLSPAGRRFAVFLFGLRDEFKSLRDAAQEGLLPGLQAGITALLPLLPVFRTIVSNAAHALGDLFKAAGKAFTAPFWRQFFQFVADTVGPNLTVFGNIIGAVVTGFAGLAEAFGPLALQFFKGVQRIADAFAGSATSLSDNGTFARFLGYVRDNAPLVVRTIGDLVGAASTILQAFAPLGVVLLTVVDDLLRLIASATPGQFTAIAVGVTVLGIALAEAFTTAGAPIALVVGAIMALAGAVIYAYNHSKPFHDFVAGKLVPALRAVWDFISNRLVPVLRRDFAQALDGAKKGIGYVKDALDRNKDTVDLVKKAIGFLVEGMTKMVGYIFKYVLPALGPALKFYLQAVGTVLAAVIDAFSALVHGMAAFVDFTVTVASAIVTNILGFFGRIIDGAAKAFGWVPGLGPKLKTAAAKFKDFSDDVNRELGKIKDRNVVVSASGQVTTRIKGGKFAGKQIPLGVATGGHITGAGTGTSDSIPAWLSNGEFVVKAASVAKYGPDFFHQLNAGKYATGGLVVNAKTDLNQLKGFSGRYDTALGPYIKAAFAGLLGQADTSHVGGGNAVTRWTQTVVQVLTELHQNLANVAAVLRRIRFESGGNPNAINLTDSNARAGHPSQGLMQTIPSTFATYAGPHRNLGITNGLANIYAGVNYALHRYGSIHAIDPLVRPQGYDSGGYLKPGLTTVYNGTGKPEPVFTSQQWAALRAGGNGLTIGGDVYTQTPEQFVRLVHQEQALQQALNPVFAS